MDDSLARVRSATDIVQLISRTVALKRVGRKYLGLCPFHAEKTPSFNVDPEKGYFHCFGCKASGSAFDFVMKRDNLDFREALELLAREARIELPRSGQSKEQASQRQQLLDAQSAASKFFRKLFLTDSRGKPAREYMTKRGFTDATLDQFRVGFAPESWDAFLSSPEAKPFDPSLLQQAGLLKKRENADGFYDTFRDRVMFPIRDETGKTVAFGGRILPGSDNPAKYLNSPETPVFSKSRTAFGIDLARPKIVETRVVAVVEGYTDVMMAHQFGVSNVVSVLGTALTEHHVSLLKRFADKIVLLFDADAAGSGAADRSLELYLAQPIEIGVATLPEGKDPDEVLLEQGAPAFEAIIKSATPALDYVWNRLNRQYVEHENDLTGQQKALEELIGRLASARQSGVVDPLRWTAFLARVSKFTRVPTEDLMQRVARQRRTAKPVFRSAEAKPQGASMSADRPTDVPIDIPVTVPDAAIKAYRWVIGAILLEPSRWTDVQQSVSLSDFGHPTYHRLAEVLWDAYRNEGAISLVEVLDLLNDELKPLAVESATEVEHRDVSRLIADAITYLSSHRQQDVGRNQTDAEPDLLQLMKRKPDLRRH